MKPNIYEAIDNKTGINKGFIRNTLAYEIDDIECAETDEEYEEAVVSAMESIDIMIWKLSKIKAAIGQLNRTDFE